MHRIDLQIAEWVPPRRERTLGDTYNKGKTNSIEDESLKSGIWSSKGSMDSWKTPVGNLIDL
jgi:hypothetical protein